jgi:hypothetical protein
MLGYDERPVAPGQPQAEWSERQKEGKSPDRPKVYHGRAPPTSEMHGSSGPVADARG